jgi:hypothetical protein
MALLSRSIAFDKYFRAPSTRPCWNITSAPW